MVLPSLYLDKAIFFVYYSWLIILVTFFLKPQRHYRNYFLYALGIWSFLGVFIHQRIVAIPDNILNAYMCKSIASEGFLYVFMGIAVLRAIVMYSHNVKFVYFLCVIGYLTMLPKMIWSGSMSPLMAILVSITAWFWIEKKYKTATLMTLVGANIVAWNWPWLCMKFACRPAVWAWLLRDTFYLNTAMYDVQQLYIFNHAVPVEIAQRIHWIFGYGFCKFIWGNAIAVPMDGWNWLFRHNDFLGLGNYLGIPALIMCSGFAISTIRFIGRRPALIGFLAVCLTCFFQMTMFLPDKGTLCLLVGAVCIRNSMEG